MTQSATSLSELAGLPQDQLVGWLGDMIMIRLFEETADDLSLRGKIAGGIHPAIGQEAVAVGVARALAGDDVVTGTHRSHHHALAKGLPPKEVLAELYGKASGTNGGRGGSMHLADFERGLWGTNGIVGAGIGIALGAALGAAVRHTGQVVTRTMLLEHVWDYHFDPQTNVIDVHVSRLRAKIDKGFDAPMIHTIRGAGYMVRADDGRAP